MSLRPLEDCRSLPLGNKAALLGQALRGGLAVPETYVLPHGEAATEAPFSQSIAVRSAFSKEDQAEFSGAGLFESVLWVEPQDFPEAVARVRASARGHDCRQDVMVMPMIRARHAGVAFLEPEFLDALVEFVPGVADRLLGGEVEGESIEVSRFGDGPQRYGFEPRLARLFAQVIDLFSLPKPGWDIEWADDGRRCWLLQIRPITRAPKRNEWLTYANIREILPDPPSVFMTDVVVRGSGQLYEYYRSFDATLPTSRPLLEEIYGRPVFNLGLLCDTLRWWGLPTRLITDNIGGGSDHDYPLNPRRALTKLPVLLRQAYSQATAVGQTERAIAEIRQLLDRRWDSLESCAGAAVELFARLVTVMLNLTASLSAPLALLRGFGVLAEHSRRHRSISTEMHSDLDRLHALVEPEWRPALAQGLVPDDPRFVREWHGYLDKHGHRGVYESDLARPRYHEDPSALLQCLAEPLAPPRPEPRPSLRGRMSRWLWWWCARVMRTRELWRYESMRCYDHLRSSILELSPLGERIFDLNIDEWVQVDQGWRPDGHFWAERQAELEKLRRIDLPHRFRRFAPLTAEAAGQNGFWQGLGLTQGKVRGVAWVLTVPEVELPESLLNLPVILVARTVDAGWIPTFRKAQAVAVELGGDLSHGSIILRELGYPAITGAHGITRGIATGDRIELDADRGTVQLL